MAKGVRASATPGIHATAVLKGDFLLETTNSQDEKHLIGCGGIQRQRRKSSLKSPFATI
jgi:hypothetical protein